MWRNSPHRDANVENYATTMFHKSSTFAAKNKRMKKHPITPIQQLVCKNVKALLVERKISVRELSININKDHSQLNKILNNQAILPAYLIDVLRHFLKSIDAIWLQTRKIYWTPMTPKTSSLFACRYLHITCTTKSRNGYEHLYIKPKP